MEWFREIAGFPNYNVSDHGRVLNVYTMHILTPRFTRYGQQVRIYSDKQRLTKPVDRLVAEAFLGDVEVGYMVRHLDGNIFNNLSLNLRIVADGSIFSRRRRSYTALRDNNKSIPIRIVDTGREFPNMKEAAEELDVSYKTLSRILKRSPHILKGHTLEYAERRSA